MALDVSVVNHTS